MSLAHILAAVLSLAPVLYRDGPTARVLAPPGVTTYRLAEPYWAWEASCSSLTVTRTRDATTLAWASDQRGPFWVLVDVTFHDAGHVEDSIAHSSDRGDVLTSCYGGWDELASGRDGVSLCVLAALRRCGVTPPAKPRYPVGPAWVARALVKHPGWRWRERGWAMLGDQ